MLAEGAGLTTAALAKQAGADRDQALTLLRDLEAARRVVRAGERRSTRWYAITDEDRIEERAAELASRSRRRGK
jgi:tRNA(Ser,Leu) C12 N-acetylase TAN1